MSQIKEEQIGISESSPFENCKLGREVYANNLTEIIQTYSDGFVLAIDNKWGAGKTTFIRMWEAKLRNSGYKTVYFNILLIITEVTFSVSQLQFLYLF